MPIQQLSPLLANQIAAGEVVERPASVVKELLENSLDAGATQINIDIEKGGVQLIRIADNGQGIHKDELALALARHATSKVHCLEDLEKLLSLGFRGEALASISAVSRLTLSSKMIDQDTAFSVKAEGREREIKISPVAHPVGTTVEVQDLFFNTPARRKFLRSEKTEFDHIETIVRRILLARFDVGIKLQHNQKILFQLRPSLDEQSRQKRIQKICGATFSENALYFDIAAASIRLWGWIVPANILRIPADLHYFYVNGRIIRDRLINHAIRQVYQQQFNQDSNMAYVLYLELPPQMVDVNVHPTKHEVRFRENRMVHDFIVESLQRVFANETKDAPISVAQEWLQTDNAPPPTTKPYLTHIRPHPNLIRENIAHYAVLAEEPDNIKTIDDIKTITHSQLRRPAACPRDPEEANSIQRTTPNLGLALAQLHDRYILVQNDRGVVIIDRFLALMKIVYGQLLTMLQQQGHLSSQPLLVPQTLSIPSELCVCVEKNTNQLLTLGIEAAVAGPSSIIVRRLPSPLRGAVISDLFFPLLQRLQNDTRDEELLAILARNGINREATILTVAQMQELLQNLHQYSDIPQHFLPEYIYQQIDLPK